MGQVNKNKILVLIDTDEENSKYHPEYENADYLPMWTNRLHGRRYDRIYYPIRPIENIKDPYLTRLKGHAKEIRGYCYAPKDGKEIEG